MVSIKVLSLARFSSIAALVERLMSIVRTFLAIGWLFRAIQSDVSRYTHSVVFYKQL